MTNSQIRPNFDMRTTGLLVLGAATVAAFGAKASDDDGDVEFRGSWRCRDDPHWLDSAEGQPPYVGCAEAARQGGCFGYGRYSDVMQQNCPGSCDIACQTRVIDPTNNWGKKTGHWNQNQRSCNFLADPLSLSGVSSATVFAHGNSHTTGTGKTCTCLNGKWENCQIDASVGRSRNVCQPGFFPPTSCSACLAAGSNCVWTYNIDNWGRATAGYCLNKMDGGFANINDQKFDNTCNNVG